MAHLLSSLPTLSVYHLLFSPIILALIALTATYFNRGLHRFPGPFLANFSQLWLLIDTWCNKHHLTAIALHEKHGNIVRLGPNVLSLADPADVKLVYGIGKHFNKSAFYKPFGQYRVGSNVFSEQDVNRHAALKKPIIPAYSMTSLTNYEPYIDKQIETFLGRLDEEFIAGPQGKRPFEMASWLQYCHAFDVIAAITWGREIGFMREGLDVDESIENLRQSIHYYALVGQMPFLDTLLTKNPIALFLFGLRAPLVVKALELVRERKQQKDSSHTDFLQTALNLREKKPDSFSDREVLSIMLANLNAGSDTTAISLRAVLYYVLRTPGILSRLLRELDSSTLSMPVTWKESQQLSYLDACIKEALRLHPAVGLGLERIVPPDGLTLNDGTSIRPGTVVGMNAWVVHRNKTIFGLDADMYNPDRWLKQPYESDQVFADRFNTMRRCDLTFGYGERVCLGRNISLIEIYKVIPSLLLHFEVQLAEPERVWTTWNRWFVFQKDLYCTLQKRHEGGREKATSA